MPHLNVDKHCQDRLAKLKKHPRVSYRETIEELMDFFEANTPMARNNEGELKQAKEEIKEEVRVDPNISIN